MADRNLPTLAGAALTASAGLAFARVFDSGDFVGPVLGAAAVPFLVGSIARALRAGPISTVVASMLCGFVYALITVAGWNPLGGLPDLDQVGRDLSSGWEVARHEAPPVPPATGTVLLVVAATWVAGLVVDQMVVQRATIGALAPPLAVFVIATALGDDGSAVPGTIGFALAACAFLLVQHRSWSSRRAAFVGRRVRAGTGLVASGTTLAVAAVVAGVVVAPALPGADGDPLLDYRGLGADRSDTYEPGILPVVDVGARLRRGEQTELFRVRADRPAYWRLVALDQFDGNWTLDAPAGSIDEGPDADVSEPFVQEFSIGPLGERWMPAAYRAREVVGGESQEIVASTTLVTAEETVSGLEYTVESELPPALSEMTPDRVAGTARDVPADVLPYTTLPPEFSSQIAELAFEVSEGSSTPFDRALALRDYFRGPTFTYDPNVRYDSPNPQDGEAVIEAFLEAREGFCVQFASAFALMARSLDIPTRLAVGYTSGGLDGDDFVVTNYEAHAWPEVYLSGIGWTNMFDPTPPSDDAGGSDLSDDPPAGGSVVPPATTTPTTSAPTTTAPGSATTQPAPTIPAVEPGPVSGSDGRSWLPFVAVPLAAIAVAGAYVAAVVVIKQRRRERRRRSPVPNVAVVGAWREAVDRLTESDITTPRTATPFELSASVARDNAPAGAALSRLATTYGAARYGDTPLASGDVDRAWEEVVALEQALEADVPFRRRWRRRLTVPR